MAVVSDMSVHGGMRAHRYKFHKLTYTIHKLTCSLHFRTKKHLSAHEGKDDRAVARLASQGTAELMATSVW